jgi:hypothetical protein
VVVGLEGHDAEHGRHRRRHGSRGEEEGGELVPLAFVELAELDVASLTFMETPFRPKVVLFILKTQISEVISIPFYSIFEIPKQYLGMWTGTTIPQHLCMYVWHKIPFQSQKFLKMKRVSLYLRTKYIPLCILLGD